jgi:predicted translin family RNA/ssDNA-binding protein
MTEGPADGAVARRADLASIVDGVRSRLADANDAREIALPACRRAIRASGSSIRAVHRREPDQARTLAAEAVAEAVSELRRYTLDRLREGDLEQGEALLGAMDDAYDVLVTVDFPEVITEGLRPTVDALRRCLNAPGATSPPPSCSRGSSGPSRAAEGCRVHARLRPSPRKRRQRAGEAR